MYYYAILALAGGRASRLQRFLLRRRAGYYWRAIREDEDAAQALGIDVFRWKMRAVVLSSAMTARRGRLLRLLLQQPLPRADLQLRALDRDHPRPDHRRHRHAVRADPRRRVLVLLGDGITEVLAGSGFDVPGVKQVFYGVVLLLVVMFLPDGIWPPLARWLGFERDGSS